MSQPWVQLPARKKKPRKSTLEGVLLLSIVILVLVLVGSLLCLRHPAASVLYPLTESTTTKAP
jgi:hypothetical protein